MSNSKLATYTRISPNSNNPRNNTIKKITIHHMAGVGSVESCGAIFASPARQASANYGIGNDGRIGLYVEEQNRAWTSSSAENDNQAITIEVSNDMVGEPWHVSDAAMKSLIDLCTDICMRNGIKKLNFTGDASGNLTMHRYFAATACPGTYLASKFPYIAEQVNKRLKNSTPTKESSFLVKITAHRLYIRTGAGLKYKTNGVVKNGEVFTIVEEKGNWYKLKSGAGWISKKYCVKL